MLSRPCCIRRVVRHTWIVAFAGWAFSSLVAKAQTFQLPSPNKALYENGGAERYFVGTVGKPWSSGTFGCVRSYGQQLHEGLDIRPLERDKQGEATDPAFATAEGTVAYINRRPALSNYGNYVVIRHQVDGIEIYSLYAHLRSPREGLREGQVVKGGEIIGTIGRTANTKAGIDKSRAHLHFEVNLLVNERFPAWFAKEYPNQRNDHGMWSGLNLLGIDPAEVLLRQRSEGARFSLTKYIRASTPLCRVLVRDTSFPWLKRYASFVQENPAAAREGIAGYELVMNYVGIPFQVIPRASSEIKGTAKFQLLSVNEAEQKKNPARSLVRKRGTRWELAPAGLRHLELLTF